MIEANRDIIGGVTATTMAAISEMMHKLIPFFLFAFILILVDLRFGIQRAKHEDEKVRPSRAIRRTFNKCVDYICWVLLAGFFDNAFGHILGIPTLSAIMLLVVYGAEINSCYSNYWEARGIKKKFNIFNLFKKEIKEISEE